MPQSFQANFGLLHGHRLILCIGHSKNPQVSAQTLNWTGSEGNSGTVIPYVIPDLPTNLWGRDILSQKNVIMCSPKEVTFTIKLLKRASASFCSPSIGPCPVLVPQVPPGPSPTLPGSPTSSQNNYFSFNCIYPLSSSSCIFFSRDQESDSYLD